MAISPSGTANPPSNLSIFEKTLDTLATIKIASIQQKGMSNPPPGGFSYSPQNDSKQTAENFRPASAARNVFGMLTGKGGLILVGLVVIVLVVMFARRA